MIFHLLKDHVGYVENRQSEGEEQKSRGRKEAVVMVQKEMAVI